MPMCLLHTQQQPHPPACLDLWPAPADQPDTADIHRGRSHVCGAHIQQSEQQHRLNVKHRQ